MAFSDDLVTDLGSVFFASTEFAKTGSYRTYGGVTTSGVLYVTYELTPDDMTLAENRHMRFYVQVSQIASPSRGDYLVDEDSVEWTVLHVRPLHGMHELRCVRALEVA